LLPNIILGVGQRVGIRLASGAFFYASRIDELGYTTNTATNTGAIMYSLECVVTGERSFANAGNPDFPTLLKNKGDIYFYPFKTLSNKPVLLFKDSLFSGLNPNYNFSMELSGTNNKTGRYFEFNASAGIHNLYLEVRDEDFEIIARKFVRGDNDTKIQIIKIILSLAQERQGLQQSNRKETMPVLN